jgi:hypothetical protein
MNGSSTSHPLIDQAIPRGLRPFFQEYDVDQLDLQRHANLIIQRTLDFGNWEEIRWLFKFYGAERVRIFLRLYGDRFLRPVSFYYWRKLLRVRKWRHTPFGISKGDLWSQ